MGLVSSLRETCMILRSVASTLVRIAFEISNHRTFGETRDHISLAGDLTFCAMGKAQTYG